ncbi:hypothetical protein EJ06DRAFT_39758 [Trichodelitschia bisporula]|uniref:Uncharacterized protein n=1 Tax=Trichodelitschia bisporula TaxID=703511 RepID=A0A6G1HV79_9PEZI|nr:hypothetical protein EJ06DRAFT_39758 [Trichodelitschia bisporula]
MDYVSGGSEMRPGVRSIPHLDLHTSYGVRIAQTLPKTSSTVCRSNWPPMVNELPSQPHSSPVIRALFILEVTDAVSRLKAARLSRAVPCFEHAHSGSVTELRKVVSDGGRGWKACRTHADLSIEHWMCFAIPAHIAVAQLDSEPAGQPRLHNV